jgi:hypothetical protein
MPRDDGRIAERGAEQDVGGTAARDEIPRHVRPIADQILRRRGLVIDVARVDVGAVVEQERRHLDRRRAMQRSLPVSAARVDGGGIRRDHRLHVVQAIELRGGRRIEPRPARDQVVRQPVRGVRVVQHAEAAGPPVAALVDVGAGVEQGVDHRAIGAPHGDLERDGAE